jgi:hypothetical protein
MTTDTTTTKAEVRLGDVRGDRLCVRCGFNLHGQTILREPHYGLFIVRCPECSGVTSLQEYPVLGRWAKRWGFMLAAAYVLIVVGLLLASGVAAGGFAAAMAYQHRVEVCNRIGALHRAWFERTGQVTIAINASPLNANLASTTQSYVQSWGPFAAVSTEWWNAEGRDAVNAQRDRGVSTLTGEVLGGCAAASAAAVTVGCVFASILPGLRRVRLLLVPLAVLFVGSVLILVIPEPGLFIPPPWLPGYVTAGTLVDEVLIPHLRLMLLAGLVGFVALGVFVGRPLCRGLLRLFLPPKYAGAFSFLWECDGKRFRPSLGTRG